MLVNRLCVIAVFVPFDRIIVNIFLFCLIFAPIEMERIANRLYRITIIG